MADTPLPPETFLKDLRAISYKFSLRWERWNAPKGFQGNTVWTPFGVPLIRATFKERGHDGVWVRPQYGEDHRVWRAVPADRITEGRFVLYENVDPEGDQPAFDIADPIDAGPWPLDNRLLKAVRVLCDRDELRRQLKNPDVVQAEIDPSAATEHGTDRGPPIPQIITRDRKQRQWRADAEDKVKDIASYAYNRKNARYQNTPATEVKGEKHPAGFTIVDRRRLKDSLFPATEGVKVGFLEQPPDTGDLPESLPSVRSIPEAEAHG